MDKSLGECWVHVHHVTLVPLWYRHFWKEGRVPLNQTSHNAVIWETRIVAAGL